MARLVPARKVAAIRRNSLQLGVLSLGLLQDGNVGVGVFPEGEEILVSGAGANGIALGKSTAKDR